jgi:tRNA (guanine-N7-)-methyltransferase
MRLRKVKHAAATLQANEQMIIQQPSDYKGKWYTVFGNPHPIEIEIGTGKGKFIIELAKKHPEKNFIGIEKYDSVLIRALEKASIVQTPNLRLIWMDAETITSTFELGEVSKIYLNFSDPWPKSKQKKRRLTHPLFLSKYEMVLLTGHSIQFKTDNFPFFMDSMMSMVEYGMKVDFISLDLHSETSIDNVETEFETKFVAQGHQIYYLASHF